MADDLTFKEKADWAAMRAREAELERLFFDKAQPHCPRGFSINYRNPGHWDVHAPQVPGKVSAWKAAYPGSETNARDGQEERAFRIRGEPGAVIVFDERWNPHRATNERVMKFRSVMAAMVWICEELMQEPRYARRSAPKSEGG